MKHVAMALVSTILLAACGVSDDAPAVSAAEQDQGQAESQVSPSDTNPSASGFDTDEIGGRYHVLVETSADLGFGIVSRIIGLNDERQVFEEAQRSTLHQLIVETSTDRFSELDFSTGLPDDKWWDPFLTAWRRFAETMETAGEWHTYFGILDYNRNGRSEIFALNAASCCLVLHVWEAHGNTMRKVLDYSSHGTQMSDLRLAGDGLIRVINGREPGPYQVLEFQWDEERSIYAHVATTATDAATFD